MILFSGHTRQYSFKGSVACPASLARACMCIFPALVSLVEILGFHSRDETAMLVYKKMAKYRSLFT